jgi:hypothetical protein
MKKAKRKIIKNAKLPVFAPYHQRLNSSAEPIRPRKPQSPRRKKYKRFGRRKLKRNLLLNSSRSKSSGESSIDDSMVNRLDDLIDAEDLGNSLELDSRRRSNSSTTKNPDPLASPASQRYNFRPSETEFWEGAKNSTMDANDLISDEESKAGDGSIYHAYTQIESPGERFLSGVPPPPPKSVDLKQIRRI